MEGLIFGILRYQDFRDVFLWILTPALKSPFHGVLGIGQFHSPQMIKPCKSPDYIIKVSFHIVVDMRQGESNFFQISTWKAFLLVKIYIYLEL